MPKTSVIMPVYNAAETVVESIQSVLNQTDPDFELIVVIDASPDNSYDVICDFLEKNPDNRVTVFNNLENRGVSETRNFGIEKATGEWISFIDSDDTYQPNFLTDLHALAAETGADIAVGAINIVQSTGERTVRVQSAAGVYSGEEAAILLLQDNFSPYSVIKIYKANLFNTVRFVTVDRAEDALFTLEIVLQSHKVAVTETPVYDYKINAASATWSKLPTLEECDRVMRLMREAASVVLHTKQGKVAYSISAMITYLNNAQQALRLDTVEARQIVQGCRARIKWKSIISVMPVRPVYAAAGTLLKISPALYRAIYGVYIKKQYGIS